MMRGVWLWLDETEDEDNGWACGRAGEREQDLDMAVPGTKGLLLRVGVGVGVPHPTAAGWWSVCDKHPGTRQ